jgi:hypothetical protein
LAKNAQNMCHILFKPVIKIFGLTWIFLRLQISKSFWFCTNLFGTLPIFAQV